MNNGERGTPHETAAHRTKKSAQSRRGRRPRRPVVKKISSFYAAVIIYNGAESKAFK